MTALPAWCVVDALVIDTMTGKKYRVRSIKATTTTRSGWRITLQKLEPPFWAEGRKLDLGWLVPAEAAPAEKVASLATTGTLAHTTSRRPSTMACESFRTTKFRSDSLDRIEKCNDIIADYQAQGLRLTLRQLYYQLVSKNIIPNIERSYKNLSSLVTDARMAGLMDWDAIEDRGRVAESPSEFEDLEALIDVALRAYRLPRWKHQENYVELWVEKQALAGVLQPIAREFHITLMVNKGYSSASAMYESAQRFMENSARDQHPDEDDEDVMGNAISLERNFVLLYLGDHDPSGEDMVRDVRERLERFGAPLEVRKVALTMAQVQQYNPPPNPAKVSDPRAEEYVKKHGASSWEVDALPPQVLNGIIRAELAQLVDQERIDEMKEQEEKDKALLRKAVASLRKKQK